MLDASFPPTANTFRRRRLQRIIGLALSLTLLIPAGYIAWVQSDGNFHVVEAGQLYRSSRVRPAQLARLISENGIKSVLNLEGARPQKAWYESEVTLLDRMKVSRYDFRISATEILPAKRVSGLLDLIREAPKPMLVQCRDGADRSGLAAALYEAKVLGHDTDDAYKQLSLRYGHFKYLGSGTEKMDETFWANVSAAPITIPDTGHSRPR